MRIGHLAEKVINRIALKAHGHISKKQCFEKYWSCDEAYDFSVLYDTP